MLKDSVVGFWYILRAMGLTLKYFFTKPVTVQTGLTVQVPLFVEQGEKIKVDTRDGHFVERA